MSKSVVLRPRAIDKLIQVTCIRLAAGNLSAPARLKSIYEFLAFFFGTFAPPLRASERPIAMACFRLVTFFPVLPLWSLPSFRSSIAFSTFVDAAGEYLRAIVFSLS